MHAINIYAQFKYFCVLYKYTYFIEQLPDDETWIVSKRSYEFNTMFKTLFVFYFILAIKLLMPSLKMCQSSVSLELKYTIKHR